MRAVLLGAWLVLLAVPGSAAAQLKTYESPYYVIHSDLDEDSIREARLRLTGMAEEYAARCKSFSRKITTRLPFYLFSDPAEYYAAGAPRGSAGVYTGDRLMAIVNGDSTRMWRTVQHEGFHQYVHAVIGGDIPVWVDEGLAEYFEEAVFTGDAMISGLIPQHRLARVRRMIQSGQCKSVPEMMLLHRDVWNREISYVNYDQAWSMIHFLAHAGGGKYQKRLDDFIRDVGHKGLTWEQAWLRSFGADTAAFERAWREYWLGLPEHPTARRYARAEVAVLNSFLARAHSQGQSFKDFDDFISAAEADNLKAHREDWLPFSLLHPLLGKIRTLGQWSLDAEGRKPPRLIRVLPDGTRLTGSSVVKKGRVLKAEVRVHPGNVRRR